MPFTPFHFGPGLLVKVALPRRVSFLGFVAAQIAVDCEPLWRMLAGVRPVHGPLHALVVAIPLGLAVGGLLGWIVKRLLPRTAAASAAVRNEVSIGGGMLGGAFGGLSHPLLDGLMHPDVRPFWPFSGDNPLLGVVPIGAIYLGCLIAGVLALAILAVRRTSKRPGAWSTPVQPTQDS